MKPLQRTLSLLALTLLGTVAYAQEAQTATLFQKPAVSQTHIAFNYAGDLWTVARAGGDAKRLTTGVGNESFPSFSPDGNTIAFTGQYDGNTDVYVVPVNGGVPRRLTFHPANDAVVGWTNDGKRVLFASTRNHPNGNPQLFTLSVEPNASSLPEMLPLPLAEFGSFSPDGQQVAYEPLAQWQPEWKRYRGGQMDYIWIAKLSDSSVEKLPRDKSNDRYPMWIGDKVYFVSDRDGTYGLYAYDTKSKQVAQAFKSNEFDIKYASAWKGQTPTIALEQFGVIHLFDVKSGKTTHVNIRVNSDLVSVRPRYERIGARITNAAISPTGARAVFEARGEIISVPADKGDARNLTATPGVMERDPSWSPDGKWIAYFSDVSGEYELHLRDQKAEKEAKVIKLDPNFYNSATWSPDSKKLTVVDHRNWLYLIDIEKGTQTKVERNLEGFPDSVLEVSWSPDSQWITYARNLDNHLRGIFVYSLETAKATQITDGMSDARYPAFDRSGKYLYFTASTNLGPAFSFAEMSNFPYQSSRNVYAVVLKADAPSPLAPESDEEKVEEKKAEEKKDGETPKPPDKPTDKPADAAAPKPPAMPAKKEAEPVKIDFEGIDQRILALPIPSRDFVGLTVGKANLIYLFENPPSGAGFGGGGGAPGFILHKFDLEKRKLDKAGEGITLFVVSANGEKVLMRQGFTNWVIANAASLGGPPMPPGMPAGMPGGPQMLKTAEMEVQIDPKVEWRQMFNEVWRGERDFFYDPNHHGLDLNKAKKMYEPYVAAVAHRSDLNYLFTDMLNQLTVGHMFIGGGDVPRPNAVPVGMLGADYAQENGRYRFAKVYNGESWNPNLRAPLTQPGVNVKAGEYLLAVNGRNLTASDNIYQALESTAGKQVVLKVGANADGTAAREVTVVPVASENGLRNRAWIEGNRRKVDELSGGKLAYVYVPDTSPPGYESFNRYYFSQTNKQGAVIDERFNGGGSLADYMVEWMSRPLLNFIYFREGRDVPTPLGAIYGPKAMIVNELAGSGGDALPWYFRKMKIGPTVGKRTWGGLVAAVGAPTLMDGGAVRAPDAAIYGLNGEWEVENVGTPADIEVELDPALWRQGRDAQLEKAVQYLMDELKKNPPPQYKRPAFPNYHKGTAAGSGSSGN